LTAPGSPVQPVSARLEALRRCLRERGWQGFIVPRADEYLGEYLPEHNERLRWLTGFTGSAGLAVVTAAKAAIFVDGRYTAQVRRQVAPALFEYRRLGEDSPAAWLAEALEGTGVVGCDPRLHSLGWYRDTEARLWRTGLQLVTDTDNPVDRCWADRPAPRVSPALLLGEEFTGESSAAKRSRIAAQVAAAGADAALVFAPDAVSWLLNVRGTDVPKQPVLQGLALLAADGGLTLFTDPERIPPGFPEHVGEGVTALPESALEAGLAACTGLTVLADPDTANAWTQLTLERFGATLLPAPDPVLLPKACKNAVEIAGTRRAHIHDGVAMVRFLAWFDAELQAGRRHDEEVLARRLYTLRAEGENFRDLSFDTISAAGANAALAHYNHRNEPAPAPLPDNGVYLVDSGGQYTDGTTDVTRTVAVGEPGAELRRMFTLVLKGHIALDRARFPAGTSGAQLDALARQFLWQAGADFDHGTGHGVGVFLSVHEGPQRIAKHGSQVALRPGMIVSNEPGYYREGAFGIRCENLVVVREDAREGDERPMLGFEAITLVPFDRRLLDHTLLTAVECDWIDAYHRRVAGELGPLLDGAARRWLDAATRPLPAG